jgi:hypothetical protein
VSSGVIGGLGGVLNGGVSGGLSMVDIAIEPRLPLTAVLRLAVSSPAGLRWRDWRRCGARAGTRTLTTTTTGNKQRVGGDGGKK